MAYSDAIKRTRHKLEQALTMATTKGVLVSTPTLRRAIQYLREFEHNERNHEGDPK